MSTVRSELAELVALKSVADPRQFPAEGCTQTAYWVRDKFLDEGFDDVATRGHARWQRRGRRVASMLRPCGTDSAAVRALRRAATAGRRGVEHAAVRTPRGRRALVRPRRRRLQGQHPHAPRRAARARRGRSRQPQTRGRGVRRGRAPAGWRRSSPPTPSCSAPTPSWSATPATPRSATRRDRQPAGNGQRRRLRRSARLRDALRDVRWPGPRRARRARSRCSRPSRRAGQHRHRRPRLLRIRGPANPIPPTSSARMPACSTASS